MYICIQLKDAVQHNVRILQPSLIDEWVAMDDLQHAIEAPIKEVAKQKRATEQLDVAWDARQCCQNHREGVDE